MEGVPGPHGASENKLRLKGRVYLRHMASVRDTSDYSSSGAVQEYSLTITMVS